MELLSQRATISTDPSTEGFDLSSGSRWIYPDNFPLRDYQFNIVQSALYNNTLVCLPTGLGKTFIAAVVMYNFWRWYPKGKIVFLAPTKPLVAQQINACYEIMGIHSDETIELTGATDKKKREIAWTGQSRARVIFATPQVFQKDLEKNIVRTELIKCIVVDEAHRALGKHAYCECIRLLSEHSKHFRVLGLSATPGSKLDAVQEVIRNLHIRHLELRDDTSPDIKPYVNERKLDIILVRLGNDLQQFKDRYVTIMDRHVRVLVQNNVIRGSTSDISKGKIFLKYREWQQKANKGHNHKLIAKTFTILLTMTHAYELMIRHGLRAFHHFYQKHEDKFWLNDEQSLMQLLEEINYFVGPLPDVRPMPDGSFPVIPEDIRFGHNKFYKLKELLLQHFQSYEKKEEDTRAIVFVEFRDIVNEVYVLLLQSMPFLRPQRFVGQAGQNQKQQKKALEDFRSNKVNVLISTSVGEEGLDVGEVDLIVCFDVSQHSPIRLVQRMGRTGRKRDGHIIVLVTDGKEHQTLKSAMSRRDSLNNKVLHSSGIVNALYEESPRMIPIEFKPECQKMHITLQPKIAGPSKHAKGKTKEPKKPRKRADAAAPKTKNSKKPVPSGSQSLMKFLTRTKDNAEMDTDNDLVVVSENNIQPSTIQISQKSSQTNKTAKLNNIKLLTSDNAAVDFLTLCTMKKSQNEHTNVDRMKKNPYFPSYHEKIDDFFNFEIPNLRILDCLKNLTMYVEATEINDDDVQICDDNDCFWPTQRFVDYQDYQDSSRSNDSRVGNSKFEALLDDSSDDSDKTFFQPAEQDDFPVTENVDSSRNVTGFNFENFMDEWSDETRMSDGKNAFNERSKPTNDGIAENSSIEKHEETRNLVNKSRAFADLMNDESAKSSEENESDTTIDGITTFNAFENLLDESASTSPEKNKSIEKIAASTTDNEATIKSLGKTSNFEDILDFSSTDSETQSDIDFSPKRNVEVAVPSTFMETTLDDEFTDEFKADDVKIEIKLIHNESIDTHETRNKLSVLCKSIKRNNDESIDLLENYDRECLLLENIDKRHFKTASTTVEKPNNYTPMNSTPKNITNVSSSMISVKQAHDNIERASTSKNTTKENFVNKEGQGDLSSVLADLQADGSHSRFSRNTNSRETLCPKEDPIDERTASEDDIFGNDDFVLDSDFEEQINNIEKISQRNVITSGNISVKDDDCDISIVTIEPQKSVKRPRVESPVQKGNRENCENEVTKHQNSSPTKSLRLELNLSHWNSKSLKTPNVKSCVEKNLDKSKTEKAKEGKSSTAKSFRLEIDRVNNDWNSEIFRVRDSSNDKSLTTVETKNSTIVEASEGDFILDDCDWGWSDFETHSLPSIPSTSNQKIPNERSTPKTCYDSSRSNAREIGNFGKFEKTTGWLTTQKPKSRLTLSKKLSRNLCNNLSNKAVNDKSRPSPDSDSENDFAVLRLETTISNEVVSDYFAKPADPINMIRRPKGSSIMNNTKRTIGGPLSLRRNDINKIEFNDLKKFSAPDKYAQKKEANNERTVGVGKRRSVSLNFDTRKRKRKTNRCEEGKRARVRSEFIDDEAEISMDCGHTSESSDSDTDLGDFVSYTQNIDEPVDMQAHYLQSVKSPRRIGGFHIRRPRSPSPDLQIYSQPVHNETNNYIYDSFCVDENDDVFAEATTSDELTRLEELEMRRARRKRKRTETTDTRVKKTRKIVVRASSTSSSEDETEKLRRQIREESFSLKNRCE